MLKLLNGFARDRRAAIKKFLSRKEEGASLVEYGLLVGLIAAVCILVLTNLGQAISAMFQSIMDALPSGGGT